MSEKRACKDCWHWNRKSLTVNEGECHRFPPEIIAVPQNLGGRLVVQATSVRPAVKGDDTGCYEFKPVDPSSPY